MKYNPLIAVLLALFSSSVLASPITITGYDINSTQASGAGGWGHTYSGTITPVGGNAYNYTGGSGTLNNGIVETSNLSTQLFNYPFESLPVITLYLDDFYTLDSLLISGGDFLSNSIPGSLTGLDLTIGGTTESFTTVGQGLYDNGRYADDFVDLTGSSLAELSTNQLVLSGFESTWTSYLGSFNTFSIAEIALDGTLYTSPTPSVPEPSTLALLALGFAGFGFARKGRKA